MDTCKLEIGQVEKEIDWNDFEACETDVEKHEPCEIDNFIECGRLEGFSTGGTDFLDHTYATSGYQEQNEEKFDAKELNPEDLNRSECSKTSVKCNIAQFKSEDIDIFYEDIKCESSEEKSNELLRICEDIKCESGEEKSSELLRICKVCCHDRETNFFKSTSYISECSCQKQYKPQLYNIKDEDMTHDVTSASHSISSDSGLHQQVQDKAISMDEVTTEQETSAVPWRFTMPLVENGNELQHYFFSKHFENDLSVEHQMIETEEKTIPCKFCSKFFSCSTQLKIHERTHTEQNPLYCKICSKSFIHMSRMKAHERTHSAEKPFQCKICSKAFGSSSNFKAHVKIHTGERPFCCIICGKSFSQRGNLKVHKRSHTGEKPFYCKVCFKAFTNSRELKKHEKIHTVEKPFQCKVCSKSFRRKNNLKVHERVHTGEKTFS